MNINSLVNMIARTLVRGAIYKLMGRRKMSTIIVLGIVGAIMTVLVGGRAHADIIVGDGGSALMTSPPSDTGLSVTIGSYGAANYVAYDTWAVVFTCKQTASAINLEAHKADGWHSVANLSACSTTTGTRSFNIPGTHQTTGLAAADAPPINITNVDLFRLRYYEFNPDRLSAEYANAAYVAPPPPPSPSPSPTPSPSATTTTTPTTPPTTPAPTPSTTSTATTGSVTPTDSPTPYPGGYNASDYYGNWSDDFTMFLPNLVFKAAFCILIAAFLVTMARLAFK